MRKQHKALAGATAEADISWSAPAALALDESIRTRLINEGTVYVDHTIDTYVHSTTSQRIEYDIVITHKLNAKLQRKTRWYFCRHDSDVCKDIHGYCDKNVFLVHLERKHTPMMQCTNCRRSFHLHNYTRHYNECIRPTELMKEAAHQQEDTDMQTETNELLNEFSDVVTTALLHNEADELNNRLDNVNEMVRRERITEHNAYATDLLRTSTLYYIDLNTRPLISLRPDAHYGQWHPTHCDQYSDNHQCYVQLAGSYYRFCHDVNAPMLASVQRYRCEAHNCTFTALDECVNSQMMKVGTIRKSMEVMVFNTVMITTDLWHYIASTQLVTLTISHVAHILKHQYQRVWQHRHRRHMDQYTALGVEHSCDAQCYGLSMPNSTGYIALYHKYIHSALDVATIRAIYHDHICPQHVMPAMRKQLHEIHTQHSTNAISMDHTYKIAKYGLYNKPVGRQQTAAADDTNNPTANPTTNPTTAIVEPSSRKRKYTQVNTFNGLSAQLLTVMDSNGLALYCYTVPSGKVEYQLRMFKHIVTMQRNANKPSIVNVISVDNASQIGRRLIDEYRLFNTGVQLVVLQDLYHAQERIIRELQPSHPLRGEATSKIKALIGQITSGQHGTCGQWIQAMLEYRDRYTTPVTYSAVGDMAMISSIGQSLIQDGTPVLPASEIVEMYSRHHPNDIDSSNNVHGAVLRPAGVTALNNLITDTNIHYIWQRTHHQQTKGTTPNESLHKLFSGRMPRLGGARTFTTAQQAIFVIQYQYNTQRLNKQVFNTVTGQYWCDLDPLPLDSIRHHYSEHRLAGDTSTILNQLEIDWQAAQSWTDANQAALNKIIADLSTGKQYCHTRSLYQWISQQPGLDGHTAQRIKKVIKDMNKQITQTNNTIQHS